MISIEIDARALAAGIAEEVRARPGVIKAALNRAGQFHVRAARDVFSPAGTIRSRTGTLRRAIGYRPIEKNGNEYVLVLYVSGPAYTLMQELGGTVRARRHRFMTIPLKAALTASGAKRGGAAIVHDGIHYKTADGEPTFIRRGRSGGLFIFLRRGKRAIPLYMLKEQVRLYPRLRFRETFASRTAPFLIGEIQKAVGA